MKEQRGAREKSGEFQENFKRKSRKNQERRRRMTEKTVEVVAALIWEKGRFLICRRPANKARALLWEFAGGKVKEGEEFMAGRGNDKRRI